MTDVITFVAHTNKPGGGELALRRYLEATNLRVRLVTMEPGGVWERLRCDVLHASGLLALRRSLREAGLVVANSMRAAFLTALVAPRRTRLVYWVRDGLTDSAMSSAALMLTKHVTARRVSHFFANSQWTADSIQAALAVDTMRIRVVHSMSGVTDEMIQGAPQKSPHNPIRLLFLGRLSPWKAPDVALAALEHLRERGLNATLTIAGGAHFGENQFAEHLRTLVDAEPAATMVGHVTDVPSLLAQHDVLVHCSTAPEPFGQVIVQALAAGMPVVATAQGGPLEILKGAPTSLVYEQGDPADLAVTLARALSMTPEISSWARCRASAFTDRLARQTTDCALSALSEDLARETQGAIDDSPHR